MKTISIAPGLALPLDVVTQTVAILAKRRAGKSYAMRRLVEQLFKAGQQVVLVDPKGDQWGVRSAADGKGPGLPIVILGGERGDVPLESSGGEVVAKLVVEDRVSALLDLSLFRKSEVATFMTAFLEHLYRLKAREVYRTPVMLVIDEADAIAPQKPQHGEERMLGAAEDIVRRGGQRGIGCVLVTQRSAVLNKNVLTQAQMLVALRTIAPQDLAAMDAWIQVHGEPAQRKTLMESLPSLPIGDAWFWSPGWPTTDGIFKRVHVSPIETFDSGATPAPGVKPVEPKQLADVDLAALTRQMAATIARAKADDPRELRRKIVALERDVAAAKAAPPSAPAEVQTERVEVLVPAIADDVLERLRELIQAGQALSSQIRASTDEIAAGVERVVHHARDIRRERPTQAVPVTRHNPRRAEPLATERPGRVVRSAVARGEADDLTGPERRILNALAWMESIGVDQPEQTAVAFLAGYTYGGGAFNNPRGALRSKGLIEYVGDSMVLTAEGRSLADEPDHALTTAQLHQAVLARLPGPECRLLRPLLEAYPRALTNEALAAAAQYTPNAGAFNNPRGRLRSLGLVEYPQPGSVRARDVLFLA